MYQVSLSGRAAIITGGTKGIGKASAQRLAMAGLAGLTIVSRNPNEALFAELEALGTQVEFVQGDVSQEATARAAVEATVKRFGRLDVLFNNAGATATSPIDTLTVEEWDHTAAVNARGVFLFTKYASAVMKEQHKGSIINMASIAGVTGGTTSADYAAAKAGVIGFTRYIGRQLAPFGIRVNALAPGTTESELMRSVWSGERLKQKVASIPLGRMAQPEEIADVVLFLASDMSSYICSETICVSGGRYW